MMAEGTPYLEPEEALNVRTFSSDVERDQYLRFGLSPREQAIVRSNFPRWGSRVLDVGCGYGRTSRPLAAMGFQVTAIDIVPRMVTEGSAATPSVHFCLMSATDLGFADASFDCVFFSFNGIDCIVPQGKRAQALREFRRVLRPGGVLVYSAHNWVGLILNSLRSRPRRADLFRNLAHGRLLPGYFTMRQLGGDLVLHYGLPWTEVRRLRAAGFSAVSVRPGKVGPRLERLGPLAHRVFDLWPFYVALK
ncbi:MAG TPA: methyltransferase domain-containing protein [Candidatus Bathyarchaeia archaeon]|nr:methyltransferase domain-containing protein [Candidatus Bathyarchaeia archaeon]